MSLQPKKEEIIAVYEMDFTYEDYVAFVKFITPLSLHLAPFFVSFVIATFIFLQTPSLSPFIRLGLYFFLLVAFTGSSYWRVFIQPRQKMKYQKELYLPTTYTLTYNGLIQTNEISSAFFSWDSFSQVKENNEFLVLQLSSGIWLMLPKRYIVDNSEQQFIKQKIKEEGSPKTTASTGFFWVILALMVLFVFLQLFFNP